MDSGPAPPAPVDPVATANAQGAANKETAIATSQLSNPNVNNWMGSQQVSYSNDPLTGNPVPTVNQTLLPQQQQLFNAQQGMSQQLAGIGQTGLNQVGQQLSTPIDSQSGQAAANKAYGELTARLDPQWTQATNQQETQLRNQGVAPGSEAYDNAMRTFNQGKNDAYSQAQLTAQQLAPQTQSMDIAGQSALLNELNAIRTGSQVSAPQFQQFQGSQVAPTNVLGAQQMYQNGLMNNYNAQTGSANSSNAATMGLIGTAAMGAMMF